MSSLNRVMLLGNLTRDPEIRQTSKGQSVGDLAIAVNRSWSGEDNQRHEEVTFVDITVWGRTAENAQKYLKKGRSIFVEGRLQLDTWEDKETGKKRSRMRVVAERLQFMNDGTSEKGRSSSLEQREAA